MVGIAIVAGIGAGTGSAIAHRFALKYPVALLARSKDNLDPVVSSIEKQGGKAIGYVTDVANQENMETTFKHIAGDFGKDYAITAAAYNVGGTFKRGSFLDVSLEDFNASVATQTVGAFLFSQHVLRNQVSHVAAQSYPEHSPTLIFTGASASLKGGPSSAAFATGKFGVRALSQSLAREFSPKGIHVAHAIIDGIIDIPRTKDFIVSEHPDSKISANAIAESYWQLHIQHRSCWTQEIDLRPWVEKF